jgi:hypothetical protein
MVEPPFPKNGSVSGYPASPRRNSHISRSVRQFRPGLATRGCRSVLARENFSLVAHFSRGQGGERAVYAW